MMNEINQADSSVAAQNQLEAADQAISAHQVETEKASKLGRQTGAEPQVEPELLHPELEHPYLSHMVWVGALSYAFSQSRMPLIQEFSFYNNTKQDLHDLSLHIAFDFDFIDPYSKEISLLESGHGIELVPEFRVYAKKLFELSESCQDQIILTITDKSGKEYYKYSSHIAVFPINQWSGSEIFAESLASFALPNIPQIVRLQSRAAKFLKDISGDTSFTAYYSEDKNTVRQQGAFGHLVTLIRI